jgi:hypothetical protein
MLTIEIDKLPMSDANGAAASYWRLGQCFGMKTYQEQDARDEAYVLQRFMHKHGAAVALVGRFNVRTPGATRYALVTEHVPVLGDQVRKDFNDATYNELHATLRKRVRQLFNAEWEDSHHYNWGLAKADLGSPVVIDFSYHSFGGQSKRLAKDAIRGDAEPVLGAAEVARFISLGLAETSCRKAKIIGDADTFLAQEALAALPALRVDPVIVACAKGEWVCPAGWAEQAPARKLRIK